MSDSLETMAAPPVDAGSLTGNLLGIDFGTRVVGLAVAHPLTGSARPLSSIQYRQPSGLEQAIRPVLRDWRPQLVVLGLPLDGAGEETPMSRRVRAFAAELNAWLPDLALAFQDERLTSEAAARRFAERRGQGRARRRDAAELDSLAAALILEAWMKDHGLV